MEARGGHGIGRLGIGLDGALTLGSLVGEGDSVDTLSLAVIQCRIRALKSTVAVSGVEEG